MTQDVYMGRKAKNPGAVTALEGAFSDGQQSKSMP
jgi:hypothetical protein